jgi:hypothetical protein
MGPSPLLRRLDRRRLIVLPSLSDIIGERVIGVRGSKQSLDREEDGADLESGRPVV